MNDVKIVGVGSAVPSKIVTNNDLAQLVDTSDEWIFTRTGIKERRISEGETTIELSVKAAKAALEKAQISPEEIDLILVATTTPDHFMPSTACSVQAQIGAVNAAAMDLSAACAGFVYGINTATQFIMTGMYKTALIIGAEVMSKVIDWQDRNTCVLFGDGAGAAVLKSSEEQGIIGMDLGANGTMGEVLTCAAFPVTNFAIQSKGTDSFLHMDGGEVFKSAVRIIVQSIKKLLSKADLQIGSISHVVIHQANYRMVEPAAKKLGISPEKFFMNVERYGNTSAASIPLALAEMDAKGLLKKGDVIAFIGFGGGLTWGSTLIVW